MLLMQFVPKRVLQTGKPTRNDHFLEFGFPWAVFHCYEQSEFELDVSCHDVFLVDVKTRRRWRHILWCRKGNGVKGFPNWMKNVDIGLSLNWHTLDRLRDPFSSRLSIEMQIYSIILTIDSDWPFLSLSFNGYIMQTYTSNLSDFVYRYSLETLALSPAVFLWI